MADAATLVMPKLGLTMTEGTVTEWKVQPGGRFKAGDILVVVETEKIANEVEAAAPGVMGEHLVPGGQTVPVGTAIARWQPEGGAGAAKAEVPKAAPPPAPVAAPAQASVPRPQAPPSGGRIIATPLAKRVAKEQGVDLRTVTGSGPRGRIKAADVKKASTKTPASAPQAQTGAQFFLTTEVRAAELAGLQKKIAGMEGLEQVSLAHLVCLGVARVMRDNPAFNRAWSNGGVVTLGTVDIGALRDAGDVRLSELMAEDVSTASGGTIAIVAAGDHDITYVSVPIAAGQSATLGVGRVRATFRPDAQGRPMLAEELGLVLTCDGRVFDTATGLKFLSTIKAYLENPLRILVG